MLDAVLDSVSREEFENLVAIRRDLHRHPELGFSEHRTARIVADQLSSFGLPPITGIGKTGIIADLGTSGPPRLMLRADMDALPIAEENDVTFKSETPAAMHACGHDGHVAIGLAVARRLCARPPGAGIRSLFQPAEEVAGGARAMVESGALDGVSAALGLHLWNQLPVGKIGLVAGAQMAAVDEFEILVQGPGGHGAAPNETFDPIVAAARIVEALQTIVSREISPLDSAVVTVGSIHGGSAFNVIPREVRLLGTARSFSENTHHAIPEKIERIARGIAAACGVAVRIDYRRINGATVNDAAVAELVAQEAEKLLGPGAVVESRTMGGEDMSVYLERVPGCFFFVGSAPDGRHRPHHCPVFDIDERALAVGTVVLEAAARRVTAQLAAK